MAKLNDDRETPFKDASSFYRSETSFHVDNSFFGQRTFISETPFKEKHNEKVLAKLSETKRRKEKEELEENEKKNEREVKNEQEVEKAKIKDTAKMIIKFIVSNLGLLIILIGYTSMGAWMFQVLEQENELTNCYEGKAAETTNVISLKTTLINYIKNNISLSTADTSRDNETVANANIEQLLQDFRDQVLTIKGSNYYTGQNCQKDTSVWNFPNALLFTITIVTTIGYGQISPKTTNGQIVCICYATIGIPIFLMCCTNISSIFSRMFRFVYSRICCGICYIKNKKKAQLEKQQKLEQKKINGTTNHDRDPNSSAQIVDDPDEEEEDDEKVSVPLTITIIFIGMYVFAGAYLFNYFENWNIITAAYFCYITLSTIGFGDYVPGQNMSDPNRNANLIIGAVYIFFGLAILAMCFDLMQEEIIAKFTWVGNKLGIVNKEDEDEEEEEAEGEQKPQNVDQTRENKKVEGQSKEDITRQTNEKENKIQKLETNEKLIMPFPIQTTRYIEDSSSLANKIKNKALQREATNRFN